MKTPWSDLIKHGVGLATLVVGCIAGLIVLSVIGIGIVISKILVFIK